MKFEECLHVIEACGGLLIKSRRERLRDLHRLVQLLREQMDFPAPDIATLRALYKNRTVNDALGLLKRQAKLENAMKQTGGIRVTEEQNFIWCVAALRSFQRRCARRFRQHTRCVGQ